VAGKGRFDDELGSSGERFGYDRERHTTSADSRQPSLAGDRIGIDQDNIGCD
jgi:hypothetical protein